MPAIIPTDHETAALARAITRAHGLAEGSDKAGIVAAILIDDRVVAWGDNEVHLANDPTRHAEIVAISAACAHLGTSSLKAATLISTLQPCEMCLAAMRFAEIDRLIFAAGRPNVGAKYFMFHGLDLEDFHLAADSDFAWCGHVLEDEVLGLYAEGRA